MCVKNLYNSNELLIMLMKCLKQISFPKQDSFLHSNTAH